MPEERFLTIQLHELLMYLGQNRRRDDPDRRAAGPDRQPDEDAGRRQLPGRRGDPAALLRGQGRSAAGDLGGEEARQQHERTIREFRLDGGRISVGGALREFRGILTGVPVYEGALTGTKDNAVSVSAAALGRDRRVLFLAPTARMATTTQGTLSPSGHRGSSCAEHSTALLRRARRRRRRAPVAEEACRPHVARRSARSSTRSRPGPTCRCWS